jgi:hypothetical protein
MFKFAAARFRRQRIGRLPSALWTLTATAYCSRVKWPSGPMARPVKAEICHGHQWTAWQFDSKECLGNVFVLRRGVRLL